MDSRDFGNGIQLFRCKAPIGGGHGNFCILGTICLKCVDSQIAIEQKEECGNQRNENDETPDKRGAGSMHPQPRQRMEGSTCCSAAAGRRKPQRDADGTQAYQQIKQDFQRCIYRIHVKYLPYGYRGGGIAQILPVENSHDEPGDCHSAECGKGE